MSDWVHIFHSFSSQLMYKLYAAKKRVKLSSSQPSAHICACLGEDLYMFIQKLDQKIEKKICMQLDAV